MKTVHNHGSDVPCKVQGVLSDDHPFVSGHTRSSTSPSSKQRTITNFASGSEMLQELTKQSPLRLTRLIVCSTKEEYLSQLVPSLLDYKVPSPLKEIPSSQDEPIDIQDTPEEIPIHPLLAPTLDVLLATRTIKTAYCPSIPHLRAYLASNFFPEATTAEHTCGHAKYPTLPEGKCRLCNAIPALVILNMVQLHHSTSEFSAQGLSRTFAAAVSAAAYGDAHLRLVECGDIFDPSNPQAGARIWNAQVPLLSGSVRVGGNGGDWAVRVISVRSVAARWFKFEKRMEASTTAEGERDCLSKSRPKTAKQEVEVHCGINSLA